MLKIARIRKLWNNIQAPQQEEAQDAEVVSLPGQHSALLRRL